MLLGNKHKRCGRGATGNSLTLLSGLPPLGSKFASKGDHNCLHYSNCSEVAETIDFRCLMSEPAVAGSNPAVPTHSAPGHTI